MNQTNSWIKDGMRGCKGGKGRSKEQEEEEEITCPRIAKL